ncbi:hypothetical protein ACO0LG_20150 [Undibacterium sp. Ji42W]|uniref:hypothetical protein n=1 Tax=Undibacterium sp. Ji42W TaxID=3413039 RepID=UPI003BF2441F
MAINIYFQDDNGNYERNYERWQGLVLNVSNTSTPSLHLRTAVEKFMRLDAGDVPLLWAEKNSDRYCCWTIYRSLPLHQEWFPAISAAEVQKIALASAEQKKHLWLRHFAQALAKASISCLSNGYWSLRYLDRLGCDPHWNKKYSASQWHAGAVENDFKLLQAPVVYANLDYDEEKGNNVLNVFAPQHKDCGRVKWWRKLARAGQMPPILIWHVHSLSSYLILDGHDRLQACLLEGVPPVFALLTSFYEVAIHSDPRQEQAILHQVNLAAENMALGIYKNPDKFAGMQRVLAQAFDRRPMRDFDTPSTANLDPKVWQEQVTALMQKNGQPETFYLD